MNLPLSLELASVILLRKKRRKFKDSPLFAAFIGITLSIIPLVLILEVSEGMIFGIMNRYIETFYSHIMLKFYNEPEKKNMVILQEKLAQIPEVQLVYKESKGAALLISKEGRSAVEVRALEAAAFQQDQGFRKYMTVVAGKLDVGPGKILLARDVAFKLNVQIGNEVALLTGAKFGNQFRPKTQKFLVTGIVSTGYQELDRLWTFISYQDSQNFFHRSNSQLLLHLKVADAFDFPLLRQVLSQVQNLINPISARANTWFNQAAELRQSYQFTKSILVYIMYLIVAVGTINIASSMVLLVLENSTEIAIMKTFGANKTLIRNIYLWVAILVSCIAIFYGVSIGLLLSYFINELIAGINAGIHFFADIFSAQGQNIDLLDKSYYLEHIPIQIRILPLGFIAVFVLVLTFLCSIVPALKAAQMFPLKILRQK